MNSNRLGRTANPIPRRKYPALTTFEEVAFAHCTRRIEEWRLKTASARDENKKRFAAAWSSGPFGWLGANIITFERPTFVYILGGPSLLKVGVTQDLSKRFRALRVECPEEMHVLALADGTKDDEARLHAALMDEHSHREWFRRTPKMGAVIDAINKTMTVPDSATLTDLLRL